MSIPRRIAGARWLVIIYGVVVFLWLGPEDDSIAPVVLLGVAGALLLTPVGITARFGGKTLPGRYVLAFALLSGAIAGAGASVLTTTLMLFKNLRHAHAFWDYPPEMMLAMLGRAPVWAAAGALLALAGVLLWWTRTTDDVIETPQHQESP